MQQSSAKLSAVELLELWMVGALGGMLSDVQVVSAGPGLSKTAGQDSGGQGCFDGGKAYFLCARMRLWV